MLLYARGYQTLEMWLVSAILKSKDLMNVGGADQKSEPWALSPGILSIVSRSGNGDQEVASCGSWRTRGE